MFLRFCVYKLVRRHECACVVFLVSIFNHVVIVRKVNVFLWTHGKSHLELNSVKITNSHGFVSFSYWNFGCNSQIALNHHSLYSDSCHFSRINVRFFQLERRKWDFPAMKHVLGEGLNGKSPKTLTVDKSTETHWKEITFTVHKDGQNTTLQHIMHRSSSNQMGGR